MLLFSVIACNVTPEPIQYGTESCHYCSMTIVDKTHASQTVTKKGKQFKYDAIECLVNDILLKENESELAHIFVANYTSPGEMIEAEKAFYFVSNAIPSPMGANLTAVKEQDKIESILKDNEYKTYTWVTLKEHFRGNKN
jgi:copper chaperone NosL